jgi:RHS repeat-associated protein
LVTVKDAAGNRASFTYDTYGNKLTAADALGNTITLSYDILGRVLSGKDAKGNITTYEYDSIGNLIKTINPLGHQTINTYNKNGAVISSVDSNGNVTTYDYDGLGNLIKTIDPLSNINVVEYDASNYMYDGRVAKTKIIDPLGNSVTYEYDSLGRRIRVIDALGNATSSEYDNVGNLTKVIDALGSVTAIEYDYFYRKTKIYDPLGHARSLTYDDVGNILTVTDANSHMTSYEYDTLYRRIKVIDPQLNITNYSYDVLGNLTAAVDAHSNRIQTTYDSLSRKISTDDPDLGYWAYEYDALGNLIKQTDAKGQVLTFEYDALNRLTKKLNSTTPIVTYYYDDYDNPAIPDFKGKLTKAVDLSGQTVFYYDKLGRETRTEKTVDGVTYVIERIYDKNSRLSAIKYPDAEIVNYTYDAAGNIKTIAGSQNYISNVDYNAKGQMKTLSFGNNTKTEYDYYSDLRLKELKTTQNSTGQVIQKLVYNFDNVGNIAAIADHVNSATQAFSYDSLDRLTQAAGTYGRQTYQYDALGNMLLKDGVNYYYGQNNSKPHAVTSGSDGFYAAYDNNGNMVEKNQAIYEYDIENRLTKIRKEAGNRVTVSMQLKPGWNLFSLPVIPDNPKISAVLSGLNFATDYDELARFNAETQSFQYYFGDPQFNQFDTLSYGIGYEIYITNANPVTLTVTGNLPPANYKVPLKEGWNLIGSSVLTSTSMQTALNNLSFGADYDNISRYDLATSTFKAAATMEKGSGYFIYCLKDTVWNIEGSTTSTQTQSQFIYDGDGGRVKVITPVLTTTYIGSLFEKDSRGKITKHIYLGPNKICSKDSTGNSYYIHPDHLGSSNITTNQTGAQVSLTEFTPYGSTFKQVGTYDPKYKFTGKELDAAGLYFYGARYYDPQIGRFISADTIVQRLYDPQSFNRYAYCRNNPIKYTDPTGHSWWNDFWDKVEEFFEDVFEDVGDFFEDVWEEIKAPLIAAAAAIASIILMVIPGGQPLAVLTWQTTWVAAMSAAATVVTLDTGEGRQLIRRVGNEFFDDVLGMRPATAYTWANITTYMAVNMAYQFTFANILNPAKVTDKQPYNSGSDKAIARDLSENGGGFNYGTQPSIDKTGALQHVDNVLYSNGKAVGLSAEALYIGGQPQHLGVVMRGLTYNINSGALLGEPIKALLHGYGVLGISHTAVNITLLNAGYSSTISSIGGGWSTYFSTFIYGPYGGNAVTSVVYNTGTEQ